MKLSFSITRFGLVGLLFCIHIFSGALFGNGFVAGTLVKVPGGYAPIETISAGDSVYCCDLQGNLVERPVAATVRCPAVQTCVVVQLGNDTELRTSPQQQFFVRDIAWRHKNAWMAAGSLSQEQRLLCKADIGECEIKDIWRIEMPMGDAGDKPAEFYDLMIDEEHNYLVTEHDLIAHNFWLFDGIVNVGSFVPYCLFKGIEKVAEVAVVVAKKSAVLLEQLLSHIDVVPIVGIFFDPEATVGKLAIKVIAKEAVLKAFGKAAVVEVVERFHPGSTKGFHIHVDNKWYAITGEHAGTGNWFEGNCDSYGNRRYTQSELAQIQQAQVLWQQQQHQQTLAELNQLLYTYPEQWDRWEKEWEQLMGQEISLKAYRIHDARNRSEMYESEYRSLAHWKIHLAKRAAEARQAREAAEKARQEHLQSLSLAKQTMLRKMDADMAEFNRTFCPDPLSIAFYNRSDLAVTPDVADVWRQRTSVLELTAHNAFRQQVAATLPADALELPEAQERIKPLPHQQYDLFLSREPEFVAFLKENGFNLADFTLAGASPTQARVCFEVEALLHGLYEQKKFSLLPGHHNPDLTTICNFANTALQKNKFYQPGNVPVSFPLIDLGNAIANQRALYPSPEIKAATPKTAVQHISRYVAETAKQVFGGTKAIVQSPKALGNLALDVGLLACPLTTNLGLMKITHDFYTNRDAVNAQLAQLNDNLRNDPILGLSQVSAGVIGAMVMHKAVGATQSLLCETRHILSGIGAGLYEEMTAASRSPYTPRGSILEMVETIDGTWTLASRYGSKAVAEGIRNLEAAAQAGKVHTGQPIALLADAIDKAKQGANHLKSLRSLVNTQACPTKITQPPCTTWSEAGTVLKNFAPEVSAITLVQANDKHLEIIGCDLSSDAQPVWVVHAKPSKDGSGGIITTQLQQFHAKSGGFKTVLKSTTPIEHNVGFTEFVQDIKLHFAQQDYYFPTGPNDPFLNRTSTSTPRLASQVAWRPNSALAGGQHPVPSTPTQASLPDSLPRTAASEVGVATEAVVEQVATAATEPAPAVPVVEDQAQALQPLRKPDIAWVYPEAAESTVSKFLVWKKELEECFMTRKKNASPELLEQYCYVEDVEKVRSWQNLTEEQKIALAERKRFIQDEILEFTSAEKGTLQEIEEFADGWLFEENRRPMKNEEGITSTKFDEGRKYEIIRAYRCPSVKRDAFHKGAHIANLDEVIYKYTEIDIKEGKGKNRELIDKKKLHIVVED